MEPLKVTREDFPKSEKFSQGMITLNPKCDNNQMNYIRDIVYIKRDEYSLTIQLILPVGLESDIPLIAYIQGSAFHWQEIPETIPRLSLLANRGFAVASIQYRGTDAAPFPAQMLDVKAAIRFLKINAEKYGYSSEKVFVMGDSSGGHCALMAGLTAGISEFEESVYSEVSSSVKGVIDLYAPIDITKMSLEPSCYEHVSPDSPSGYLIGRKNVLENIDLAKPTIVTNYINVETEIPPIIIFHGTNDETVPFGQSCMLYDKLKECNKQATFYAVEGAHHGGHEFWSNQILDIVEDFINKNYD